MDLIPSVTLFKQDHKQQLIRFFCLLDTMRKTYTAWSGDIALFIAVFVNNYIRIYVGKECRRRVQTDIKVAITIICGLYMEILAVCENGGVRRYCRGRREMICCFLQIIPFRNLNSMFDTAVQVTEAEVPLCSPLFGSDWRLGSCRLRSVWRIECSKFYLFICVSYLEREFQLCKFSLFLYIIM
jgi:hypothetical protein